MTLFVKRQEAFFVPFTDTMESGSWVCPPSYLLDLHFLLQPMGSYVGTCRVFWDSGEKHYFNRSFPSWYRQHGDPTSVPLHSSDRTWWSWKGPGAHLPWSLHLPSTAVGHPRGLHSTPWKRARGKGGLLKTREQGSPGAGKMIMFSFPFRGPFGT